MRAARKMMFHEGSKKDDVSRKMRAAKNKRTRGKRNET